MGIFNPAYNSFQNWTHFGDERDGDLNLAGVLHLTAPLLCRRITVQAAGHIFTDGWPIFASEFIHNDGLISANAVGPIGSPAGLIFGGLDGGAGGLVAGGDGLSDPFEGISGNGGDGGSAGINAGGIGGVAEISANYFSFLIAALNHFFGMDDFFAKPLNEVSGGSGGGGGAGDGINAGADGGGGGGIISLVSPVIISGGLIEAMGADGAAAAAVGVTGGGGGGGGGYVFIRTKDPGHIASITVTPGLGGFGFGGGNNGSPGYYGSSQLIQIY